MKGLYEYKRKDLFFMPLSLSGGAPVLKTGNP